MSDSGSSVSAFVTTLIINGAVFAIFTSVFVCLKKKQRRVYQPRATVDTVAPEKKPDEQPNGPFAWFNDLLSRPESYIVQQTGADGYFFLRYLFNFFLLSLVGGVVCWIILFPVNATNSVSSSGGDVEGFDIIGFVNVRNKYRYFAHAFVSWFFFGLVIYTIYRELVYYVSFRQALQATPLYDSLLSSRTLFLTDLPEKYRDEEGIRTLFPLAQNIWFARSHKELEEKVKERAKLAAKYEAALNKVIKKSMKIRAKLIKKNTDVPAPENELIAYIPEKKQPTHRLKFLIGKKVKTLVYGPEHLGELNSEIADKQSNYTTAEKIGSAFLEFPSQVEAQRAYQAIPYAKELKNCQRIMGAAPEDIIWENTGTSFAVRHIKNILARTLLTLTIIFWSIPVLVVGCISNINYLTTIVPFLSFINNLPQVLMGIITGLLPTILLALLMSLLPPYIRKVGKIGGLLTVQQVEFWCQSWYFGFQVVQVFIVTTLASSLSTVVSAIISDPGSAMTLLAQYLPRLSNFYIPYMLLQGLSVSSGALAQVVALVLAQFLGKILDGTPRKQWNRYNTLGRPGYGTLFPVYQLMAVILLVYSIIAPLIIAFSMITFLLIYVAYLYNLTYVMDFAVDARGRHYPKLLFQTFTGLYLAEICLLGLFIMAQTWGPLVLEAVMLGVTVLAHFYFKYRFFPLLDAVPISVLTQSSAYNPKDQGRKEIYETGKSFFVNERDGNLVTETGKGNNETLAGESSSSHSKQFPVAEEHRDSETTGGGATMNTAESLKTFEQQNTYNDDEKLLLSNSGYGNRSILDNNLPLNGSWFQRFIHPLKFLSLPVLKNLLPLSWNEAVSYNKDNKSIYVDPLVSDPEPKIWIPKDPCGLSVVQVEKAHSHDVFVSDENASIDDMLKLSYHGPPPDYEEATKQ